MKAKVIETGEIVECELYEVQHAYGALYETIGDDPKYYYEDELEIIEKDNDEMVTISKELYEHLVWCREELERINEKEKK